MEPIRTRLAMGLARQHGHLFEWVPVCLAVGIGAYFTLKFEPSALHWTATGLCIGLFVLLGAANGTFLRPVLIGLAMILVGASIAGLRTQQVSAPVLSGRYYGPIEGTITQIDRSGSDAVRLTLENVRLADMPVTGIPVRIRVSLHGQQGFFVPEPGLRIMLTGHLAPPSGPVEPGGFDFRRQAWFSRLGAVGYTRTPALVLDRDVQTSRAEQFIQRTRHRLAAYIRDAVPGQSGAFAAAITTGDRSALDPDRVEALRASNLSHLLAISGLHMGLVTGFVFTVIRVFIAFIPAIALRLDTKRIAAVGALIAGAGYLVLSGGNVATVRAFAMAAVALGAVLVRRRALTLRAVAVAATIILCTTPEALTGPGFQMSFAATTALVAVFAALNTRGIRWRPAWLRPFYILLVSSSVAGAATAPIAAAHFNRIADFGLIANLLAVPVMGLAVMPGAVIAVCLWSLGLSAPGFLLMSLGIEWILLVADTVSAFPGAVTHVPSPPLTVLPLLALGALWVILIQGGFRSRLPGLLPVGIAFMLWAGADRPDLLVSDTGRLVGLLLEDGRILSKPRGDGFSATTWLENDGDGATQQEASARAGGAEVLAERLGRLGIAHVAGRGARDRATEACTTHSIVVTSVSVPGAHECTMIDSIVIRKAGSIAIYFTPDGKVIHSEREFTGNRPWSQR